MANLTEDGNRTIVQQLHCSTGHYGVHLKIFISALNIPLSITAFLGNVLIIVALQKVSSLHPPSKHLFGCLASTDICVGLITQSLFVTSLMSTEHSTLCFYSQRLIGIGSIFCGVSLSTMTAISVDRVLALLLGMRYRQVVTLRRVRILIVAFWLVSVCIILIPGIPLVVPLVILISCIIISTLCYLKIYLKLRHHQAQVQEHVNQGQPNVGGSPLNVTRYRKTVSSALWLQMALLACYLPLGIVAILSFVAGLSSPFLDFIGDVTSSLLLLNSSLNPFLYCWKVREVRQAVKDTIRHFWCFSS